MAVNKNFVVKNGLEVNQSLILANADTNSVGIGTTVPGYTLHVNGGIGATDSYVTGISTVLDEFNIGSGGTTLTGIGGSIGIGTASPEYLLDVRSPVSTGQTALYVKGDVRITGDINIDDITLDSATVNDLNVTGLTTLGGYVDINDDVDISGTLNVSGITTLASSGGITTTGGDFYVGGDLYVLDDIYYDEVNGRNINISGVSTFGTVQIASGIVTATTGVVTYYGDGSNLTGTASGLTAAIGVGSESTFVGAGVTEVYFASTTGTSVSVVSAGTSATVTITPGVSLGLAIALGG